MRGTAVGRAAYGALLLLASGATIRIITGGPADRASAVAGRVLGLRHLAQALIIQRAGTRNRLLAGVAIDAAHAFSMVGLAALDRNHRRLAALDAVLAGGLALNGLREARNA